MKKDIRKYFSLSYYQRKCLYYLGRIVPETIYWYKAQKRYRSITGRQLSYRHPKDLNEKLMWLTRYWRHPLKTICADKVLVREFLLKTGLGHLLIPIYGVYSTPEEIDFNALPSRFVLKCNHGCGFNIIVPDKTNINKQEIIDQLNNWLSIDYSELAQELHYRAIPRKIICEQLLSSETPIEYQFWCVNGTVDSLLVCRKNRDRGYEAWSYSTRWEQLNDRIEESEGAPPKPHHLTEMIHDAETLSRPFPFVRVDFYEVDGEVSFAELTFTPSANILSSYKYSFIMRIGEKLTLPSKYR